MNTRTNRFIFIILFGACHTGLLMTASKDGLNMKLLKAIKDKPLENISSLIERGAEVNASLQSPERSPLALAAFHGRVEVVQLLLEKKAAVNYCIPDKCPPLIQALVQSNAANTEYYKILFYASLCVPLESYELRVKAYNEIVEILVLAGADVNYIAPHNGNTPLHYTSSNLKLTSILLNAGANKESRNKAGLTPEEKATAEKSERVATAIREHNKNA